MDDLLILGAGGFGRVLCETAQAMGCFGTIAFLDDGAAGTENVLAKCGAYRRDGLRERFACAYPAFGDNAMRFAWLRALDEAGYRVPTFVHPQAYVSPSAEIGQGAVVLPKAVVNTRTRIGEGSIINIGALVDHDCTLGVCCHIAPGAVIKAGNVIDPQAKIESGTVVHRKS